jgi:hypothetical protein
MIVTFQICCIALSIDQDRLVEQQRQLSQCSHPIYIANVGKLDLNEEVVLACGAHAEIAVSSTGSYCQASVPD